MLREAALRLSGRWRSKIWTILILASTGLRQNTDGRLVNCPRAVVKSRCGTNPTAHREANEAGNEVFLQKVLASTRSASVRWLSVSKPTDAKLPAFVLPVHQPHGERRCISPEAAPGFQFTASSAIVNCQTEMPDSEPCLRQGPWLLSSCSPRRASRCAQPDPYAGFACFCQ